MDKIILNEDSIKAKYSYVLKENDVLGSYIHCSIKDFNYRQQYLFLAEGEYAVLVPIVRYDDDVKYDFNSLLIIESDYLG